MQVNKKILENSIILASENNISGDLLDGEVAILNLKDGIYYGLNSVGNRIWKLIQRPISVEEMISILLDEFDVDEETCYQEVINLLEDLSARNLIEINNAHLA